VQKEISTIRNKGKIRKLIDDLERCKLYIKYLEKIKAELTNCKDHLELKEEALVIQDERIIQLEDAVEKLKSRIKDLTLLKIETLGNMDPIAGILACRQTIADHIASIRRHIDRTRVLDPINLE